MDTTLLQLHGLIVAFLTPLRARARLKCMVSRLEGLPAAVLQEYREDCRMGCHACWHLPPDSHLESDGGTVCPDSPRPASTACPDSPCPDSPCPNSPNHPTGSACPDSIAYVLTTSGTTGVPKIVQVPHCSIVPNIVDLRSRFGIVPDDVVFNAAPLTFDPSIVEVGGTYQRVP